MATKTAVREATLVARINRKLADQERKLQRNREGSKLHTDFGRYMVVERNTIKDWFIRIEDLGRDLGVLAEHEALAEGA